MKTVFYIKQNKVSKVKQSNIPYIKMRKIFIKRKLVI